MKNKWDEYYISWNLNEISLSGEDNKLGWY